MLVRLQKVLAEAGVASRRAAEKLILDGRVLVNGQPVTKLGTKVDPETDRVEVGGKIVKPLLERIYVLLNKPRGYVSTVKDPEGRRTVVDLVGPIGLRLYPVCRLDMDTEGLLLLTNDGEMTNALTHPRRKVPKTYIAEVEGSPSPPAIAALQRGVRLEDGPTSPAEVKVIKANDRGGTTLSITIHEGRNRQVRRMLEVVGHPVTFLKRIRFGPLDLHGVRLGQHRFLTSAEVAKLRIAAGGARRPRVAGRRAPHGTGAGPDQPRPETTPAPRPGTARPAHPGSKRVPRGQAGLPRLGSKRMRKH